MIWVCMGWKAKHSMAFLSHLYCGLWSDDNLLGTNSNIRLKNIQVFMDEGLED